MKSFISSEKIVGALFLFLLPVVYSISAQEIERKIIIKGDHFYYTTIDEELQLATLHTGNIAEPLKKTNVSALPSGRNYNDPIIPFCWDLADKNMFSINFITNAMNSRGKALKFFPLSSLSEFGDRQKALNTLEMSFEQNVLTYFEPYAFITDRSAILENFFFDGIALSDSSICIAMANRGELSIWKYENDKWEHSEIINLPIDNYFSLFTYKRNSYLILSSGQIYSVSTKGITELPEKKLNVTLPEIVLLVNKNADTVQLIERKHMNSTIPFDELTQKYAIRIF